MITRGQPGRNPCADWSALSYVTADAGTGLQAGITTVQQERQEAGQPALENGLDVFHTAQEAKRVLRQSWNHVERCWEQAEAADRRVEQAQRQGQDARGVAVAARCAWKKAVAAFEQHERGEAGWKIAHGALSVFRSEGPLNDRAWAEQQIALALPLLSGRAWSKVRGFLQTKETLTFLDRLHRQLREAVPADPLRAELVRLWWLRRQRPRANTPGSRWGCGSCGASGATGGLPEGGRELADVVRGRGAGVAPDGPRQQCGGVHEQRAPDASVAAQDGDAGLAGLEAPVLELSRFS